MTYRIDYFRDGMFKSSAPWSGSLEETVRIAADGLARHRFDVYRIISCETGAEVACSLKQPPQPAFPHYRPGPPRMH